MGVLTDAIVSLAAFAAIYYVGEAAIDLTWRLIGPSYIYLMLELQDDE